MTRTRTHRPPLSLNRAWLAWPRNVTVWQGWCSSKTVFWKHFNFAMMMTMVGNSKIQIPSCTLQHAMWWHLYKWAPPSSSSSSFFFFLIYLLTWKVDCQRSLPSSGLFCAWLVQDKARSQELHLGFPQWYRSQRTWVVLHYFFRYTHRELSQRWRTWHLHRIPALQEVA